MITFIVVTTVTFVLLVIIQKLTGYRLGDIVPAEYMSTLVPLAGVLNKSGQHFRRLQAIASIAFGAGHASGATVARSLYVAPGPVRMRFAHPASVTTPRARRRHRRSFMRSNIFLTSFVVRSLSFGPRCWLISQA